MSPRKSSRPKPTVSQAAQRKKGDHWSWSLVALFVVSTLWRLSYLARLLESPLSGSMLDDSRIYWEWSGRIAAGELVGSNPFFLAPLYPYVVGGLRALAGDAPSTVLFVQALWGSLAVVLLADGVKRLTRPIVGIVVGTILSFYEMAVFFDGLLLTESLLFCLGSLLMWWVVRFDPGRSAWWAVGVAGGLVGLLAAGRPSMAVVLIPLAWLLARAGGTPFPRAIVLLLGFVLAVAPMAMHNYAVSREWIPFTYSAGFNLHAGNNSKATGTYVPITGPHETQPEGLDGGVELDGRDYLRRSEGRTLSPAASSDYWGRRAAEYVTKHPGHALKLAAVKLAMLWNAREYPQIENVEEYRRLAGPVGLPVIGGFALLGTLAIAGAGFAWKAGGAARFALIYAVVVSLGTIPFFVTDRYRHQLVPACAFLAGVGIRHLMLAWRRRELRRAAIGALVAGLVVVHLPVPGPTRAQQAAFLTRNIGARLHQSALGAARAGRLDEAERDFTRAIEADPGLYQAWGGLIRVQLERGHTASARESFARARAAGLAGPAMHAYDALFAALSGDAASAERALSQIPDRALQGDPDLADVVAVTRRTLAGGD